ncbi:MAG: MBL fold metallo-hydrolase, partial [Pedobacter sp.]
MQRRKFIQNSAMAMALLSFYKSEAFASNFAKAYQFKALRNDVGVFMEQGGT